MAPMNNRKVHLRLRNGSGRTACGLTAPPQQTNVPANVTCGSCQRSVAMADAEVLSNNRMMRAVRRSRKGKRND